MKYIDKNVLFASNHHVDITVVIEFLSSIIFKYVK
jgi:hypothetical protein